MVEAINRAKVQRDAIRADLVHQPKATMLDAAEVYAMIDSLGDAGAVIEQARPDSLAKLYRDLRLEVRYRHAIDGGEAIATIAVANDCVRGGLGHESVAPLRQAGVHATDITNGVADRLCEFETTGGIRWVTHMYWPRSSALDLLGPSLHLTRSSPSQDPGNLRGHG